MRRLPAIVLLAICMRAPGGERPAFQTLRYNEDWSFLHDAAQRTDLFDPAKYIPLNPNGDWHLSFGGEARLKYELYTEPAFNQQPADDDGFLLQRYLLHADLHATPHLRFFGQLQSSLEDFRNGGPRPTDRDDLDLHQAFLDARLPLSADDSLTLRAGRQEMALLCGYVLPKQKTKQTMKTTKYSERLTPENAALLLIDHGMLTTSQT